MFDVAVKMEAGPRCITVESIPTFLTELKSPGSGLLRFCSSSVLHLIQARSISHVGFRFPLQITCWTVYTAGVTPVHFLPMFSCLHVAAEGGTSAAGPL
ncbi:hypothetical protein FQA47_023318 [Oryzias melastigma]|uniref:Uncharacterized protein n=1 Tax=Oryzias melastigma TaxID=30732 RepID=A0A834CJV4_ORYME|nr:hypothetical protein FQA47_023318 [Oryzias melastigma]